MNRRLYIGLLLSVGFATVLQSRAVASHSDELYLKLIIVTGESSRDSNSTTRTLTISTGNLTYEETYHGAGASRRTPVKKQFKLTDQDLKELIALLKAKGLLTNKALSKPPGKQTNHYFRISITSALDGKEHSVSIEATPTSDLKNEALYQNSVGLIEKIYAIINKTDPAVTMPTLAD